MLLRGREQTYLNLLFRLHLLRFGYNILNRSYIEECRLRILVHLAFHDRSEALYGLAYRNINTRHSRELLSYMCRLREESLDLSCSVYCRLILFRQLVHTEDGNDVLEFCVFLQYLLHLAGNFIVFLADYIGFEDTRC